MDGCGLAAASDSSIIEPNPLWVSDKHPQSPGVSYNSAPLEFAIKA